MDPSLIVNGFQIVRFFLLSFRILVFRSLGCYIPKLYFDLVFNSTLHPSLYAISATRRFHTSYHTVYDSL